VDECGGFGVFYGLALDERFHSAMRWQRDALL
jgi:hypothetical protein